MTLRRVERHTGLSRTWLAELVRTGQLRGSKIGRGIVVEQADVEDLVIARAAAILERRARGDGRTGEGNG